MGLQIAGSWRCNLSNDLQVAVLMGFIIISAAGVCVGELIRVVIWMNHSEWLIVVDQIEPYAVTGIVLLGMLGAAIGTGRLDAVGLLERTNGNGPSPSIKAIPLSLLALFAAPGVSSDNRQARDRCHCRLGS